MIVDAHHHLGGGADYADQLNETCERLEIDRVCLLGLPDWFWDSSTNSKVEAAFLKYPHRFIGFAYVDLGKDPPDKVNEHHDREFRGLKFDFPPANYDDPLFFPIYERAANLGMPLLFHTGITARTETMRGRYLSSAFMRPIYLDTIARYFPELNVIMAHAGNPWLDEAAMALRINPNLYSDLTGSTLKYRTPERLRSVFWWGPGKPYGDPPSWHAFEKIVFGSDVSLEEYEDVINDYRKVMETLELDPAVREKIWSGTMMRLLGLNE
jgi:predicted TIM-barrel fold metal-dependent hydrolase